MSLKNREVTTVFSSMANKEFDLFMINNGNASADGLQIHLWVPSDVEQLSMPPAWEEAENLTANSQSGYRIEKDKRHFVLLSRLPIPAGCSVRIGKFTLKAEKPIPAKFAVLANGGYSQSYWVTLRTTNGPSQKQ